MKQFRERITRKASEDPLFAVACALSASVAVTAAIISIFYTYGLSLLLPLFWVLWVGFTNEDN